MLKYNKTILNIVIDAIETLPLLSYISLCQNNEQDLTEIFDACSIEV